MTERVIPFPAVRRSANDGARLSQDAILVAVFAALYVSEGWYLVWAEKRNSVRFQNKCRSRAVVIYDRVMNSLLNPGGRDALITGAA